MRGQEWEAEEKRTKGEGGVHIPCREKARSEKKGHVGCRVFAMMAALLCGGPVPCRQRRANSTGLCGLTRRACRMNGVGRGPGLAARFCCRHGWQSIVLTQRAV